jgi:hypothetical protein
MPSVLLGAQIGRGVIQTPSPASVPRGTEAKPSVLVDMNTLGRRFRFESPTEFIVH